jgi:hypothetical protein
LTQRLAYPSYTRVVTGSNPVPPIEISGENSESLKGEAQNQAHSPAFSAKSAPVDPELSLIVDRWLSLPDAIRAGIVAMVKAAGQGDGRKAGQ